MFVAVQRRGNSLQGSIGVQCSMEDMPDRADSALYRRLKQLRIGLPIAVFFIALTSEMSELNRLGWLIRPQNLGLDSLLYVAGGPVVLWLAMTWLTRRIRERDEAEACLSGSYHVSRQVANASNVESLLEIALSIPAQVLGHAAASLAMRAFPGGSWVLAGTRGLSENQRAALETFTMNVGDHLLCSQCAALHAIAHRDCPMLAGLQSTQVPAPVSAICLPLSREYPHQVVLSMYLTEAQNPSIQARHMVESLASGLAVAIDRARLHEREVQMLQRMEQAVKAQGTSEATLAQMLADVGAAYGAEMGVIFPAPDERVILTRTAVVCWPGNVPHPELALAAQEALQTDSPQVTVIQASAEIGQMIVIPLVVESRSVGVVILGGHFPDISSQLASLSVAAGMMAMVARNSQLYAALKGQAMLEERYRLARDVHDGLAQSLGFLNLKVQQVERMLHRQQSAAAVRALQEVREGIAELFAEVRLTLQDLRSPPRDERGLVEHLQDSIATFANRSGLDISLVAEGDLDLSPDVEVQLLHIVQEALTNVHRHAEARCARVFLRRGPQMVTLQVQDDGIGFPDAVAQETPAVVRQTPGFGLRILQERVEAMRGQLEIHSAPGKGVLLRITIPAHLIVETTTKGN